MAGIIEPNDGECHMVNNEYTHSDKQVGAFCKWIFMSKKMFFKGLSIDWTDKCEIEWKKCEYHICCDTIAIGVVSNVDWIDRRSGRGWIETRFEQYC